MIYQMTCNFLSGCVLATESVVHKQTFSGCHFVLTVSVVFVLLSSNMFWGECFVSSKCPVSCSVAVSGWLIQSSRRPFCLFVGASTNQSVTNNLTQVNRNKQTETQELTKTCLSFLELCFKLELRCKGFFSPPNTSWARIKKYNAKTLSFMDLDGHWTVKRRQCFDSRSGLPEEK